MARRKVRFSRIESTLIYLFPYLRHLKYRVASDRIRRDWRVYYCAKLRDSLDHALRPSRYGKVNREPGGYLVELTDMCNLRCPMCGTDLAKRKKKHMDLETYRRLLRRIKDEGINVISLHTVGEPLIYPHLEEAVALARGMGIEVGLTTNANLTDRLKAVYRSDPKWVRGFRFSVDSAVAETYEKIRRGGRLEKVIESCEWVLKTNRGCHMSRIALTIECVISRENIGELATFFRTFSRYTFPEQIRFGIITSASPDTAHFERNKISFPNLYRQNRPCNMVFNGIYFNNEASATLCCRDYDNQLIIGSALDEPIAQLWRSEAAEKIRQLHLGSGEMTIPQCRECWVPKPGVWAVLNNFIHTLPYIAPGFDDGEWCSRIKDYLGGLDAVLGGEKDERQRGEILEKLRNGV